MRRFLAPAALLALALLAPSARALGTPTVPTVTVPTVTTPPLPVPPVTVPPLTTPVATTPAVTTPGTTEPPVTTPTATTPPPPSLPAVTAAKAPTRQPSPAVATTPGGSRAAPASTVGSAPTPRPQGGTGIPAWSGRTRAAARRLAPQPAVKRFTLASSESVHVTVWQESPRCRLFGHYRFAGSQGANVLHLPRRVDGRRVTQGTYRLVGLAAHREVLDVHIRVVRRRGGLRVRRVGLADACDRTVAAAELTAAAGGIGLQALRPSASRSAETGTSPPGTMAAPSPPEASRGPAGAPRLALVPRAATARTLLFVLLGLAIALLATASLPASATGAGATRSGVARHRAAVASAGFATLVAAILAELLT